MTLVELFHRMRGLTAADQATLEAVSAHLTAAERKQLRELLVTRRVAFKEERYPVTDALLSASTYSTVVPQAKDADTLAHCATLAAAVRVAADKQRYEAFKPYAAERLRSLMAPHLLGLDAAKDAIILQLAMPERFHILLLGDPGTGKTDLLRSACELSTTSAFGLGSGASKAGLSAMVSGKEIKPGILAQANGGLCAIDELNLLKAEDRGALYNAMEKGFISFDKGGVHARLEADIRLLATANPKGDRFKGSTLASMRAQLPFDAALLSRFNLLCIVRKPSGEAFRDISMHAIRASGKALPADDIAFAKGYLAAARNHMPKLTHAGEEALVEAVSRIRDREDSVLIEVTPRLATGLRSLALARARLAFRDEVSVEDAQAVIALLEASLTAGVVGGQRESSAADTEQPRRRLAAKKASRTGKTVSKRKNSGYFC